MDDFILQSVVTLFLVMMPLFGPVARRKTPDFAQHTIAHSIYGVNENGKLEILKKERDG